MQDLKLALIQRELHWENPAANRQQFARDLAALDSDTDLAILPEMFTTGFSMAAEKVAEDEAAVTLPWLQQQAAQHDIAICGSLAVRDNDKVYNRLLFVTPSGDYQSYDKRHLFRMSGEDEHFAGGSDKLIVEYRGWRLCPMICYDLRFPVWTRNQNDYDALIFVANWPAKRRTHWRQLLIARAIENQAYCVGLNRVGSDGNKLDYSGDSLVLAADGEMLLDCEDNAGVFHVTLDYAAMERYRSKFPCHKDADTFDLHR
jgi:omega-amidase